MPLIYQPKGRAGEYAKLALNLYEGCSHGCWYCYAEGLAKAFGRIKTHQDWLAAKPRPNVIEDLEREAEKLAASGPQPRICLCFTCDPYQPIEAQHHLTKGTLAIFKKHGLNADVLTKAGERAMEGIEMMSTWPGNRFGITLTSLRPGRAKLWEPGAAPPGQRVLGLRFARSMGLANRVSLEPVIHPPDSLACIERLDDDVDHFDVGKLNKKSLAWVQKIDPEATKPNWPEFREQAVEKLEAQGRRRLASSHEQTEPGERSYYIKKDLEAAA